MISESVDKTIEYVAGMSYENWLSLLLAALAVLLALVTLIVAIAGIAIALVGIWGLKALRKAAEQKAHNAVQEAVAQYPEASHFIKVSAEMTDLYRRMQQLLSVAKQEFDVLHQQSAEAAEILDRLNYMKQPDVADASNGLTETAGPTDIIVGRVTASYPGEEADSDASNAGKTIENNIPDSTDPR